MSDNRMQDKYVLIDGNAATCTVTDVAAFLSALQTAAPTDGWATALPHDTVPGPLVGGIAAVVPLSDLNIPDEAWVRYCDGLSFSGYVTDRTVAGLMGAAPRRCRSVSFDRCESVTAESIELVAATLPDLKALIFTGPAPSGSPRRLARAVGKFTKLEEVRLSGAASNEILSQLASTAGVTLHTLEVSRSGGSELTVPAHFPNLTTFAASEASMNDTFLEGITVGSPQLTTMSFDTVVLTAAAAASLGRCTKVTQLSFDRCHMFPADAVAAAVAAMPALTSLSTRVMPEVTDAFVAAIAQSCPGLTTFNLDNTNVTDAIAPSLAKLTRLRELGLLQCGKLGDATVSEIATALTSLESLNLVGTSIGHPSFAKLAAMPCLTTLALGFTKITDDGMAALAACPALTSLDVSQTSVTKKGCDAIAECATLRRFDNMGPGMSYRDLALLRQKGVIINGFPVAAGDDGGNSSQGSTPRGPRPLF